MKIFAIASFLSILSISASSQVDGYLSEYGTNGSTIIKINKITKEVVCNYTFCKDIKDITVFTDLRKIILIDSVTINFDENGNMTTRIRYNKGTSTKLIDSFYYNSDNQLAQISSTSFVKDQETNVGYTIYTYGSNGKIALVNTSYSLSNGLTKDGLIKNVYNSKNQLIEVWKQSNLSKLVLSERFHYDRRGRVKKIDNYNADYETEFSYCWRTTRVFSTNENEYYHKSKIVYNRHHKCIKYVYGNKLDEFFYNPDGTMSETKSHYNDNMISITQHHYYKD